MAMAFTAPDDWREDDEEEWTIPAAPARRGRALGLKRLICAALGALAIAFVVATRHGEPSSGLAPVPVAAADWVVVPDAKTPFLLQSALFDGRAPVHERHVKGEAVEDILSIGALDAAQAYLRVTIARHEGGRAASTLFLELALQGGDSQLSILRAQQPFLLPTRFGVFEVAPMTVTSGAAEVGCLGFRSGTAEERLHISGLACGAGVKPLGTADLVCILDGLTLAAPAEDEALDDFFRAASSASDGACAQPHTSLPHVDADHTNSPGKTNIRLRIRKPSREAA